MAILAPRLLTSIVCVSSLKIEPRSSMPLIVTGISVATRVLSRAETHFLRPLASRLPAQGKQARHVVPWRNGWPTPPPYCGKVFEIRFQNLSDKFNVSIRSNRERTIFSRKSLFSSQGTWSDSAHRPMAETDHPLYPYLSSLNCLGFLPIWRRHKRGFVHFCLTAASLKESTGQYLDLLLPILTV